MRSKLMSAFQEKRNRTVVNFLKVRLTNNVGQRKLVGCSILEGRETLKVRGNGEALQEARKFEYL